jgi:hypothetical protein
MNENPFKVHSPEEMSAEQVVKLFVPIAEDFEIEGPEHMFIHGHRGCGKSMMLRMHAPDCQMIVKKTSLAELPFLGVYATIKATGLDVTEYERLNNQFAGLVLAEHSLVTFLGAKVFQSLKDHCSGQISSQEQISELKEFVARRVLKQIQLSATASEEFGKSLDAAKNAENILQAGIDAINAAYGACIEYLRRSSFSPSHQPYHGPLLGYRDFLFPILENITGMSFMPQGKPVYFLLDDADNLNVLQTQVLNSWVAIRSGNKVALKISTQLGYKTHLTTSRQRIDAIHDFREIFISSIHTGPSSKGYPQWVEKVLQKRFTDHEIEGDPLAFFPVDAKQEKAIAKIEEKIRASFPTKGRGFRPGDDAYRYARVDYIKSLSGSAKQLSNYRYAGFQQLVHISSGIVRYFLDNATEMYSMQQQANAASSKSISHKIRMIEPTIQDAVVREAADQLMFGALDSLENEALKANSQEDVSGFRQLRNLIRALGGIFQEILLSDRSERRVFSIALSDDPPEEIMRVLRRGVQHGYFYEAAIGSKEGSWRTRRYVMTRRLAPHFKLDPMGFSGYLFVTSELLGLAIANPKNAVQSFKEKRLGEVLAESQLSLEL